MRRQYIGMAMIASMLLVDCGSNPTGTIPTTITNPSSVNAQAQGGDYARFRTLAECSTLTYVGPIRLPISVHETTVQLSWLGSDDAIRGYELSFERYDVTNVWVFAMHDVVTKPEAKEFIGSEGTYRVRVRGLFCNDGVGGWTDWVVFSTDDHNTPISPVVLGPPTDPPPPVDPPVVCENGDHNNDGHCDSGNPPVDPGNGGGNGNGNEGDGSGPQDPLPPSDPDVTFCHVGNGNGQQTLTLPNSQAQAQHLSQHANDYLGVCIEATPNNGGGHGHDH